MKLAAVEADVVYGLYVWRGQYPRWNAMTTLKKRRWRSLSSDEEKAKAAWGGPIRVKGIGYGCTLFNRDVLEAIRFRNDPEMDYHGDWTFGLDCEAKRLVQVCHTGVVCGHILKEHGGEDGTVAWPDIEAKRLYRWARLEDSPAGWMIDEQVYNRNAQAETVAGSPRY